MNSFLDLLAGEKELQGLALELSNAVATAIAHEQWRLEYMTFADKLREEREEGRKEGREEGLKEGHSAGIKEGFVEGILSGVRDKDYSIERAAEKLGVSVEDIRALLDKTGD